MKVTSPETLARLLSDRLAESGDPSRAVTLSEFLNQHLAYPLVRAALGLADKGEYDLAVLHLLSDQDRLQVDPVIAAAATRELATPEPALTFSALLSDHPLSLRPLGTEVPDPPDAEMVVDPDPDPSAECRWCGDLVAPDWSYCPRCGRAAAS